MQANSNHQVKFVLTIAKPNNYNQKSNNIEKFVVPRQTQRNHQNTQPNSNNNNNQYDHPQLPGHQGP